MAPGAEPTGAVPRRARRRPPQRSLGQAYGCHGMHASAEGPARKPTKRAKSSSVVQTSHNCSQLMRYHAVPPSADAIAICKVPMQRAGSGRDPLYPSEQDPHRTEART